MQDFNKSMDELSKLDQELGLYNTENKRMIEPITVTYTEPKLQLWCTQEELEAKAFKIFTAFKANTFSWNRYEISGYGSFSCQQCQRFGELHYNFRGIK